MTIPVTVSHTGDEDVTLNVEVTVLRDTDKDGTPDKTDLDDDGDGINDTEEAPGESKKVTKLTATATNPTEKATEGQPYTSGETAVVTKNKPNAVISSTETNGLKVNAEGKVEGTPRDLTWNGNDEEQTVSIPVTVSHDGDTPVTLTVDVKVLRVKDALTSGKVTPTNKAVDGQPYTSTEKVINPNKPGTTVTPTSTNGLTIDGTSGKVTGTPTGLTWNGDVTEQIVNIPVVITKGNETINETIPVVVQRSSRNGQPETQEKISEYTKPIGTTGVDGNGNLLEPPVVDIPEYTEPIGTSGVDENGNLLEPPVADIPEYTEPIGTSGVDENGNLLEPPVADIPEYTKPIGTTGVDENGNLLEPPVVDISEYTGPIGTTGVDENGNLIAPPVIDTPEFNGGVNGDPEVQPELPEFNGGVNGEPEVQPELPEFNGEVDGEQQGRGNKPQPTGKVEKSTKRLANTGESETNTGLAGLGLAVLGSLLTVAKRRREDEE